MSEFNIILADAFSKFNKKTRADKIRAMSDDEIAQFMSLKYICPDLNHMHQCIKDCKKCWSDWLEEEGE